MSRWMVLIFIHHQGFFIMRAVTALALHCEHPEHPIQHFPLFIITPAFLSGLREGYGKILAQSTAGHTPFIYTPTFS